MLFNKNRWLLMFRLQLQTSVTALISKKYGSQKIASKVMLGFLFFYLSRPAPYTWILYVCLWCSKSCKHLSVLYSSICHLWLNYSNIQKDYFFIYDNKSINKSYEADETIVVHHPHVTTTYIDANFIFPMNCLKVCNFIPPPCHQQKDDHLIRISQQSTTQNVKQYFFEHFVKQTL